MQHDHFARPSARIGAFAWDYLWISLYLMGLSGVGAFFVFGPLNSPLALLEGSAVAMDVFFFLITVLPVSLYFAISEATHGGTWGKRRKGLRVITTDGGRLGFVRALVRALTKFLPWQIAHLGVARLAGSGEAEVNLWSTIAVVAALGATVVYVLLLVLNPARRTVHDYVAGTVVEAGQVAKREGRQAGAQTG